MDDLTCMPKPLTTNKNATVKNINPAKTSNDLISLPLKNKY